MSAAEAVRLRFQALVARGLASSEVAARVGLRAASEVWGGGEPRDRPAWYLWLRDAPGAWQVELAAAEPLPSAGDGTVIGHFTVRHYPARSSPTFESFSPDERRIAAEAFDATGTPRIEVASSIPGAHFVVGTVDWALEPDGDAVIALAAVDRLRTRTDAGEVVRDVPGWRLSAPVFSLLAGLQAQVERRAASRIAIARSPGFELVGNGHDVTPRDVPDAVQGEALLLLRGEGRTKGGTHLLDALRDPAAETVADVSFAPGEHPPHELAPDPRLPVAVGHAWFGGEEHAEDLVACAC